MLSSDLPLSYACIVAAIGGGSMAVARGGLPAAAACLPDADERSKQRSDDENRTSHPASALLGCGGESLRPDPAPTELRAASATRSCDRRLGSAPKPQLNRAAQRARRRRAIDVHTRVEEVRLLPACSSRASHALYRVSRRARSPASAVKPKTQKTEGGGAAEISPEIRLRSG